ncbi:MAG: ModD protein [Lachnospiraceae bacterium]|nr:ModD protein [Lachnospiraceae bacterium]
MFIAIEDIDRLIKEDVPYIDLTGHSLGISEEHAQIEYYTREDCVVCGTEVVRMIFERLNIDLQSLVPTASLVKSGDTLIVGKGCAADVMMAWKVGQNVLDNCSGIATKTKNMVTLAKSVNPDVSIFTTRKGFPGTKSLAMKAIMAGGATPHRLGISETILIFKQHQEFIGGFAGLLKKLPMMKHACCEKKIIVEASTYEEALALCEVGADGIQFDKLEASYLTDCVRKLKVKFPYAIYLATGGITEANVKEYAKTGIDGIVTTSLYVAKPIDIGVRIEGI